MTNQANPPREHEGVTQMYKWARKAPLT